NEKIGELEEGYGEFGPIQIEEGMKLHVGQSFDDEEDIVYNSVELTEGTSFYVFNDLNLPTERDVHELINNLYNTAYRLSMNSVQDYIDEFNKYFYPDSPAYKDQRSAYLSAVESDYDENVNYINYDVTIDEIKRTGAEKFDVTYELTQIIDFAFDTGKEDELKHYSIEAAVVFEPTDHPD